MVSTENGDTQTLAAIQRYFIRKSAGIRHLVYWKQLGKKTDTVPYTGDRSDIWLSIPGIIWRDKFPTLERMASYHQTTIVEDVPAWFAELITHLQLWYESKPIPVNTWGHDCITMMSQTSHTMMPPLWYHIDITRTSHCEASHCDNTVTTHWCHQCAVP